MSAVTCNARLCVTLRELLYLHHFFFVSLVLYFLPSSLLFIAHILSFWRCTQAMSTEIINGYPMGNANGNLALLRSKCMGPARITNRSTTLSFVRYGMLWCMSAGMTDMAEISKQRSSIE
jgi:hypothetical protein